MKKEWDREDILTSARVLLKNEGRAARKEIVRVTLALERLLAQWPR